MNFWKKIENLGITSEMPIYKQKSTMFFNIAMRISMIFMIIIPIIMHFALGMVYTPIGFVIGLPFIAFSLFLNYKGKVNISVLIISIFFPIYFLGMSLYAKSNGEGLEFLFYVLPRFGIFVMTILSFAVLGFDSIKLAIVGSSVGVITFFSFDYVHTYFGLSIDNIEFHREDFKYIIIVIGVILIFVIAISSFLQKINSQYEKLVLKQREEIEERNEELKQQNEEIAAQRDEIEAQRDTVTEQKNKIEEIHHEISQSIDYAKRLQSSILPNTEILKQNFSDFFVLFKPKDKVSGDFFWWTNIEDYTIITAADCTGHGVPGAFMSMLGVSFLREIVTKEYITDTSIILRRLRKEIIKALNQTGKVGEQKDGMDMALISINHQNNTAQFSGANNPLYLIRDENLIEYKADKMPIAIYENMDKFTVIEIELQKNDLLYMFSDGYADQFGGPKGKKYKYKALKQLLIDNANNTLENQKNILNQEFEDWKGSLEQVDDVVILGIKI